MSKSTQGQLHNSWHNFSKYRPLIRELVTRDLKVKYRRSVLGYMWSILNPLLMMLLQTLVFSYMFRFDIPNFPLYLICGNTLFNFFNESTNMGMGSVLGNASLIKKVYVPKFIFPISRVVSSFVNLLFSLAAILLVMLITARRSTGRFCSSGHRFAAAGVLLRHGRAAFGAGGLLPRPAIPVRYPDDGMDVRYTAVLSLSALPPFMVPVIKLNPLYHYINCMRCLVMYGTVPGPNTWIACIGSAVVMMSVGLAAFRKLQRNFILYL